MEGDLVRINEWLLPLSWVYGLGVRARNALYDVGVLEQKEYDIPVISVGNITAGGTGKTPHTEMLIRLLGKKYQVAVLSRGYKRKTSGYILADLESTVRRIGDEPWQMKQKFPDTHVAVCKNRRKGIERLCSDPSSKDTQVILLDDAYQHRHVKPGLSILLVDYHRIVTDDKLLPAGRLREPIENMSRANIVIVTKCPQDIKPMDYRVIQKALNLPPFQDLFFSTMHYRRLRGLFVEQSLALKDISNYKSVLLLTGIASPEQMKIDLGYYSKNIVSLAYPDHHQFRAADIQEINSQYASMPQPSIIVTTEKDATRLITKKGLSDEVKENLFVLPVDVKILRDETDKLNELILGYVRKNSRNRILAQG